MYATILGRSVVKFLVIAGFLVLISHFLVQVSTILATLFISLGMHFFFFVAFTIKVVPDF